MGVINSEIILFTAFFSWLIVRDKVLWQTFYLTNIGDL